MILHKIVVAPDSFKGSLAAAAAARAMEQGVREVFPDCEAVAIPVADGGEGICEAIVAWKGGERLAATVSDPLGRPVRAVFGITDRGRTAVVETAAASGLTLLSAAERDPLVTTGYGTGELIRDALSRGCRHFLIGLGGSATNDAGTGLLQALGYRFLDAEGRPLGPGGRMLARIASIDDSDTLPQLSEATFVAACDVDNPFYGENGPACVFAPQKGADAAAVRCLDEGLRRFAEVLRRHTGCDPAVLPGAGAAGGTGGTLRALLGAELVPGIETVLDAVDFDDRIAGADLVLTGEGKLDRQTLMGKAPLGVLRRAAASGIPVIGLGGAVEDAALLCEAGFAALFPIVTAPADPAILLRQDVAAENLRRATVQVLRALRAL